MQAKVNKIRDIYRLRLVWHLKVLVVTILQVELKVERNWKGYFSHPWHNALQCNILNTGKYIQGVRGIWTSGMMLLWAYFCPPMWPQDQAQITFGLEIMLHWIFKGSRNGIVRILPDKNKLTTASFWMPKCLGHPVYLEKEILNSESVDVETLLEEF